MIARARYFASLFIVTTFALIAVLAASSATAQSVRRPAYCDSYPAGSALPPPCLVGAPTPRNAGSDIAVDIDTVQSASRARPKETAFANGTNLISYDLTFKPLCGNNSINSIVSDWVGERKSNFSVISDDRNVALAAVVTFPNAKKDETKQVKVPLIVKANFGDPTVQNCDEIIFTDIPANQRVNMHFEFRKKAVYKFSDQSKFLGGVLKIATGGAALVSIGGSSVFAPAVTAVAISFLQKNTDPVKNITAGMNEVLESFPRESTPDPVQYPLQFNVAKLAYRVGSKDVFVVTKEPRLSHMTLNPARGWMPVSDDFTTAFKPLQDLYTNAQTAVDSPWSEHMPKFCDKLRLQVQGATKGDRIATALGIGNHAFLNAPEYKTNGTCLNKWEVFTLANLGYAPPFPDAWDAQVASGAAPPRLASTMTRRNIGAHGATHSAAAHRQQGRRLARR